MRGAEVPRDDDYYEKTRVLLEQAFLEAGDFRRVSGFGGDEARWESQASHRLGDRS
jgi:hypothetical protein